MEGCSECEMMKEDFEELKDWLLGREMDIATSEADLGELQGVFRALFGREARKSVPLEEFLNKGINQGLMIAEEEAVESFSGLFGK